ncbi:hypothetical protein JCM10908_002930 [Rhodotorula pacifica]|uniref:uncharacterized protein n=1 Tax=Rhodotorula pacifica TaxID=1495444 RepID=UPI0031719300
MGLEQDASRTFANSLQAAKPLTLKSLLDEPVEFVDSRSRAGDDAIPYTPINVKPQAAKASPIVNGTGPSVNGSPVASTSKLPAGPKAVASPASATAASQRMFPLVDTSVSWPKVHKVGAGLRNLGNTCFLNSALQVLLHTPPLVRYLESQLHPDSKSCPVTNRKGFCMICSMRSCVRASFIGQNSSYAPNSVVKNLKNIAKHFRLGRQEDSHEFLRFLMDALQAAALFGKPAKLDQKYKEQTFVHQLFGGRLRSRVHCTECGHNSDTFDSILDLSLDLGGARSLRDALENLVRVDVLKGQNKYKCERCKKLVIAEKGFKIDAAPLVLTVHLKRFTPTGRKAGGVINYPESLRLGPYMSTPEQNPSYRLYGVVLHSGGGLHSGHYTAYVRAANNNWYDMNDDYVRPVGPQSVLGDRDAYCLFYIREKGDALKDAIYGNGAPASNGSAVKVNGNGKRPRESFPPSAQQPQQNGAPSPLQARKADMNATASSVGSPIPRAGEPSPKRIRPTPVSVQDPSASRATIADENSQHAVSSPPVKVQFPFLPPAATAAVTDSGAAPSSSPPRPSTPGSAAAAHASSISSLMSPNKVKQFQSRTGQSLVSSIAGGGGGGGPKIPVVGRLKPRTKQKRKLVNGKGVTPANLPRTING